MSKQEIEDKIKEISEYIEGCKETIARNNKYIEEVTEILAGHEKYIAELQAELEQCGKRWRAEIGGRYWFVDSEGCIENACDRRDKFEDWHYTTGNYFATQEEAEEYKKALLIVRECECCDIERYGSIVELGFKAISEAEEFGKALRLILNTKEV